MSLTVAISGTAVPGAIPPSSIAAQSIAKDGDVGFGNFVIDDPAASITTTGHKMVTIEESACAQPRLFTGYLTERGMGRSTERGMFVDDDRLHDATIVDLNAAASFRIITYATGKRPEETMGARLTWLLGHQSFVNLAADTGFVTYYTLGCDAADFTGGTPKAVLDDLAGRKPGITWFLFWDTVAGEVALYFGPDSTGIAESSLSISNDPTDVNPATGVYPPDSEAKLRRTPEEVYSEVMVTYGDQSRMTYRKRESTSLAYIARGTTISRPYTQRETTAQAQAEAFLDNHATETDTIATTIKVYPEDAGLVTAGQRMDVKFVHLPGYDDWTSMRVVSVNIRPSNDVANTYLLDLELEKPKPGTGPAATCDGTSNFFAGITATTGAGTNTGQTVTRATQATDGLFDGSGIGAEFPSGVLGAGTWVREFEFALGADYGFSKITISAAASPLGEIGNEPTALARLSIVIGGTEFDSSYATGRDPDVWPIVADGGSLDWVATWDFGQTVTGTSVIVRETFTTLGLGYIDYVTLFEILGCATEPDEQTVQTPPSSPAGTPVQTTADPTANDDVADGYQVGQLWQNTTTGDWFILTDNTAGAAVWAQISGGAAALDDLTDVNAPAPSNGDVLTWDSTPGEWIAAQPAATVSPASTVQSETTWGITAAVGTGTAYARNDHTHGSPANPVSGTAIVALGFVGELLISDTPSTPLVFADILQNEDGTDLLYADL